MASAQFRMTGGKESTKYLEDCMLCELRAGTSLTLLRIPRKIEDRACIPHRPVTKVTIPACARPGRRAGERARRLPEGMRRESKKIHDEVGPQNPTRAPPPPLIPITDNAWFPHLTRTSLPSEVPIYPSEHDRRCTRPPALRIRSGRGFAAPVESTARVSSTFPSSKTSMFGTASQNRRIPNLRKISSGFP